MRTRTKRIVIGAAAALGALLLVAGGYLLGNMPALQSGGSGRTASVAPYYSGTDVALAPDAAQQSAKSAPMAESQTGAGGTPTTIATPDRMIVMNASMEVRVDDIDTALPSLRAAIARAGGEISDLQVSSGYGYPVPLESGSATKEPNGPSSATVTIRVPAERLDALSAQAARLGTVVSQSQSANDVTEQAIDLEARLANLRAEEARLRTFLTKTNKVVDLLAVERELSRVRGDIEAMDAQLTYLKRQTARATLVVTLSEPAPVASPAGPTWGLTEAVTAGLRGAVALIAASITVLIAVSPLLALALVVWLVLRPVLRRRAARRAQTPQTEHDESLGDA